MILAFYEFAVYKYRDYGSFILAVLSHTLIHICWILCFFKYHNLEFSYYISSLLFFYILVTLDVFAVRKDFIALGLFSLYLLWINFIIYLLWYLYSRNNNHSPLLNI